MGKVIIRGSFHGVGLSGTSLAVSEDGAVVALEDLVHQGRHDALVDIRLKGNITVLMKAAATHHHVYFKERLHCYLCCMLQHVMLGRRSTLKIYFL